MASTTYVENRGQHREVRGVPTSEVCSELPLPSPSHPSANTIHAGSVPLRCRWQKGPLLKQPLLPIPCAFRGTSEALLLQHWRLSEASGWGEAEMRQDETMRGSSLPKAGAAGK